MLWRFRRRRGYSCHQPEPLHVANDGKNGVNTIDSCLERYALVDIKRTADGIDQQPQQPLLGKLACQCPQGNDAQCCSEGISHGHGAVSMMRQKPPDGRPQCHSNHKRGHDKANREMGYSRRRLLGLLCPICPIISPSPGGKAIDCCQTIIDGHSEIGIKSGLVVEYHVDGGHHYAG